MASLAATEAIVVWDIENTRVPVKLLTRCYDIVQWLLEDIQARSPTATVVKVYVAGTFDNYPVPIKTALCTHPRVQLLYSIGKGAKGGEADDALKRVILDFHSSQLAAGKQAVIALLSGDADYNNVVDAARVANHKIFLYHCNAVAHTLQGNVDYSEPWPSFLARKSGEQLDALEDVGFSERYTSPYANMGSGSTSTSRSGPHTPAVTFQPIPMQYCTNSKQRSLQHPQTPQLQGRRQSASDSHRIPSMQLPLPSDGSGDDECSGTTQQDLNPPGVPQSGTQPQPAALKQTTMRQFTGQRQGSAMPHTQSQPNPQRTHVQTSSHKTAGKQAFLSASSLHSSQNLIAADASTDVQHVQKAHTNSIPIQQTSMLGEGAAMPCSDGRSVVISGFKKGMPSFEAKERALAACKPHGSVSASWVRKGRTGCWFVIAQFHEAASAETMLKQGCGRYSKNGSLAVRWYMSDVPAASSTPGLASQATLPATQLLVHGPAAGLSQQPKAAVRLQRQSPLDIAGHKSLQSQPVAGPCSHMKSFRWVTQLLTLDSSLRVAAGAVLLAGYFVLLAAGF